MANSLVQLWYASAQCQQEVADRLLSTLDKYGIALWVWYGIVLHVVMLKGALVIIFSSWAGDDNRAARGSPGCAPVVHL